MAASEIRSGDLVYRDTLFVEVGDGKRHPRAAPSELKELLLPKKGNAPLRDQVAHWYEAQLVHYGLTRSKDKNIAKVRLTAALSTDGLKVPADLQRKEADMKKEYAAAVRKVNAAAKKAIPSAAGSSNAKKRKAGSGPSTTISLQVDGVELTIDRRNEMVKENVSKKIKTDASSKTKAMSKPKPAKAATSTSVRAQADTMSEAPNSRPKQTARRSRPYPQFPSPSSRPTPIPQPFSDHTPSTFHNLNEDDDDGDDDAPPAYDSIYTSSNDKPSTVQISGCYAIETDQTTSEMVLRIDHSKQQLWGRFEVGSMEGVLSMNNLDGLASGDIKAFSWRAEDTYSQQFYFRRDQTGWLQFDGNGLMRGCFSALMSGHDVEFDGRLVGEDVPNVPDFRSAWDRIPRLRYGREKN